MATSKNTELKSKGQIDQFIAGESDSIDQHLDMLESGPNRGENIQHRVGKTQPQDVDPRPLNFDNENYDITSAEEDREGDELTGDEHSSGLQGGEQELTTQPHVNSGLPGEASIKPSP